MRVPSPRVSPEEVWCPIEDFPGYSVSPTGYVRNDRFDRVLSISVNNRGVAYVGMLRQGVQHKRAIAPLVAQAFLEPHPIELFKTPINLDGNRTNNYVENLMWRPLWFAMQYHQQFIRPRVKAMNPLEDVDTGEQFENVWFVCARHGVLSWEVWNNAWNNTHRTIDRAWVWPTHHRFRIIDTTPSLSQRI